MGRLSDWQKSGPGWSPRILQYWSKDATGQQGGQSSPVITGAQPKSGTGHIMQSISVVFSSLYCEGYIADLRYRWLRHCFCECSLAHWNFIRHFEKHQAWSTVNRMTIAFWGTTRSPAVTMHKFMRSENLRVKIWRDNFTSDYLRVENKSDLSKFNIYIEWTANLINIILKNVLQSDLDVLVNRAEFHRHF